MSLDSDVNNADSHLSVEFFVFEREPYKGKPFVRIMIPGDKTSINEQMVADHHKQRFPRQWLHFQMQTDDAPIIGTPLTTWHKDDPEGFSDLQMAELQILKFQTVEQLATASDSQIQKVGMGAAGLRERSRTYLNKKNQTKNSSELEETRSELQELKAQMAMLMEQRKLGRPRKEV